MWCFMYVVLGIEVRTLCMLDKHSPISAVISNPEIWF